MPPPRTQEAAEQRMGEKHAECKDWYFCKKDLKLGGREVACVNVDGTISPATIKACSKRFETPRGVKETAGTLEFPLFRVRSRLRQLGAAGLVTARGINTRLPKKGRKKRRPKAQLSLFRLALPLDDPVLVRAFCGVDQEPVFTGQPDLREHIDRHVLRVGRREIPDLVEDELGLRPGAGPAAQALGEGERRFGAGRLFPEDDLSVACLTATEYSPAGSFLPPALNSNGTLKVAWAWAAVTLATRDEGRQAMTRSTS